MEKEKYNKIKYNNEYNKKHYKQIKIYLKLEEYEKLEKITKKEKITKAQFIKNAINKNFKK